MKCKGKRTPKRCVFVLRIGILFGYSVSERLFEIDLLLETDTESSSVALVVMRC